MDTAMEELPLDFGDEGAPAGGVPEKPGEPLPDNPTVDAITGEIIAGTSKELVRQRIANALIGEYGINPADMARDFSIRTERDGKSRRRRADIVVFAPGAEHVEDNIQRVAVCKPEPKNGRTVTKIRSADQAQRDLDELKDLLGDERAPDRKWGMWTDGIDLFFLEKTSTRFGATYAVVSDWPMVDETVHSHSGTGLQLRRADQEMLKLTFRRCHNYIHGNEGMPKDAAFWQFLYLLFAKMYDEERVRQGHPSLFFAGRHQAYNGEASEVAERVHQLFREVKNRYAQFGPRDELALSDRALAFLVSELDRYDLSSTDIDAKGLAYQELVGNNLRGDRGQYFTPRGAVKLAVEILDPQDGERVLDPACGTGGFLRETLSYQLHRWKKAEGTAGKPDTEHELAEHKERLQDYADRYIFGADFDPFLVRATRMSIMMVAGIEGNVYHMDSLAFPNGHLDGLPAAKQEIGLGSIDVLMTNPPFGTDIKIMDPEVLEHYRDGVAQPWIRDRESGRVTVSVNASISGMSPEQLFIQRAVEWVRPGGRIGIVLPNGILSNPGPVDEAIRRWILDNCWILASVELPVETFIVDANVNILTTLLFLKRKTQDEIDAAMIGGQPDYPIFMAVAEKVGFDRRGNTIFKRGPDGTELFVEVERAKRIRTRSGEREVRIKRKEKIPDNDLPVIAERYHEFRTRYPIPGAVK